MSGHSKWSTIKHKKGAADAKRGKLFSKLAKEITVAARLGGGSIEDNSRLRVCVAKARSLNMPKDNVSRAIKKGTGEGSANEIIEVTYEGYAHGGIAVYIECLTDNKVRTVADVRHILSKYGGNLGESGSVAWNFDRKGLITLEKDQMEEEELFELILEAGAEDLDSEGDLYEIYTAPDNSFVDVMKVLEDKGLTTVDANVGMIPKDTVKVDDVESARKVMKAIDLLEDHDDIQNVSSNFDIDDAILDELEQD